MEMLILVVAVMLIVVIVSGFSDEKKFYGRVKDCRFRNKPHNWSYNKKNTLECIDCGFVAGQAEIETNE